MYHRLETVPVFESNLTRQPEQLKSRYDIYGDHIEVYDIVWGDESFDHPIFTELAKLDALRRLQSVEQLTLPDRYKTIPNSTYFSRWEHAWGSAILAGRLARQQGISEDDVRMYQLKSLLQDVCHTAHSHAGDWILNGAGKSEDVHDMRRPEYADVVGISEVLRRYKIDPEGILEEKHDGITSASMPDLDADRVDYTMREAYRWVNQIPEYRTVLNKDSFVMKDGQVVCANKDAAKLFGISYVLLVTEHWQDPAHRLQLELFMESMKRVMVAREGRKEDAGTYSPLDLLMVTDDTLADLADEHDEYLPMMHELMSGVSEAEVNGRWRTRADRVRVALESGLGAESSSIEWLAEHYDNLPRSYEINESTSSDLEDEERLTVLNLPKLRKRTVDPLYVSSTGEVKRLSEYHEGFRTYESEAIGRVQKDWRAAIIGNIASTTALKQCLEENRQSWPDVLRRPRMPNMVLRKLLRETVRTSNGMAAKTIECNIH